MATRHHDDGRVCHCDQPDGTCAGLAVRRLSQDRVGELAEEIWAGSSGDLLPGRPLTDPRGSRAGASAQAAYRRHRDQERERWRPGWVVRVWAIFGAASGAALLIGLTIGDWLALPMALLAAVLTWWRLRFRPSAEASIWRRQAAMQRRTASVLGPLGEEGYLILHDITLPGWLASLDHLVVGPTGVWVVESGQRCRRLAVGGSDGAPAATLRGLRGQAGAIAEVLDGSAGNSVRGVLCRQGGGSGPPRSLQDIWVAGPRQLADVVRHGSKLAPGEVELATARLLAVLRPAA
jgi:nuclease-like protein